jgi:NAD(P)-dependent dehydrogenase (short-subunit alcohol dehydrogenase family)
MTLTGQTVLISGANRGIGAALVRELLKRDVRKVYATARSVGSLPDFCDVRSVPLQLDVTDNVSVEAASSAAADIDILINNAGTAAFSDWLLSEQAVIDADMVTNLYGTLRVIRAFAPHLQARHSGTIVNVISVVGLAPVPALSGYSASKAALQSLTQALRGSLADSGIKVVGVYPGPIDTDLARDLPFNKATPEHAAANIVRGLESGEDWIFPDPIALEIGQLFETKARQVEAALQAA